MFDIKEYEAIVMQYSKPLYRYCYLKLRCNKELTEETQNDIFRILYEKWDKVERGESLRAYLYRVADMCIKNSLRKHNRYYARTLSLEETKERGELSEASSVDEYFVKNIEKRMDEIADMLTKDLKELFVLRYIEEKTLKEIADIKHIPYSTLRLRLAKVENAVRSIIND
ncbi:MAG: sigma-70 family RNA polymerase sigma factor [Ruminococcaceae bacterium]|nr:sigma-70 family RNA polymerase sigma factor [Oscillospiraceae bacterium]